MPSILDLMGSIQQQGEHGRQRGLASLVGKAYAQPDQRQQILATVAQRGAPDMAMQAQQGFSKMDETAASDLAREAGMFVALAQSGDEQTIQAAYQQLARKAQQAGHPVPLQYNPSFLPGIEKLASAGGAVGGNVQSTYIDAQGNRVAIMRDGSTQVLGQNAPSNQIIDTGNGFFGVNKGNLQAAPVMMGGQAPQQQRAPGEVPFSIDPSLPPEVQASIRQNESAFAAVPDGGSVQIGQQGQQLRSAPKPAAPITPYQQAQLGMQQQRLEASQQAAQRAAEAAQAAQAAKQQVAAGKAQKARVAAQDSVDAYTDAIQTIDTMRSHPGYADLGTPMGDFATNVPVIRTDAKGANASLETLKSQIMINTLSKLKALSATGAAGFGALNQSEGDALRRAIANLDTAQSHADLDRAVLRVREVMQRSAERIAEAAGGLGQDAQQPAAPQSGGVDDLLSKYGVK